MADNLFEFQSLSRSIVLTQIYEKTLSCGIVWNAVSPTAYKATVVEDKVHDLYLCRVGNGYILDVFVDGRNIFSERSLVDSKVEEVYVLVDTFLKSDNAKRAKELLKHLKGMGC